ncbi:uncharacterized protein CTRU02_212467 [Colletotrichum truncatum]|uniref:Uncharacterized protein n=1 Tax=Colletotrichum truncatum TaxID=5467 RepID=A0ACC3YNM0_COLTU|nr:uncharacterized protein CTRU02_08664 [Colletotrichum truncatum]KAF6789417.1 hypothetical protein CTRU02_08664 [Colletotrichum truncatum]
MTGGILNESWLRGVQQTGTDGVVRFKTIFPGWYNGRATHIHLLAHNPSSAKQLPNHTVASESPSTHSVRASHVGQIFFDATLLDRVAETHPYKSNAQWRIKNEEDAVLMEEGNVSDPMVQYVTLGNSIETGIFGWIAIGNDPQVDVEVKIAATWFGTWGRMWRKLWH